MSLFKSLLAGSRPTDLGVHHGKLKPCPNKPNCVATQTNSAQHKMAPIQFEGNTSEAISRMEKTLGIQKGAKIIEKNDHYIRAEFTSELMGYVDDVEFLFEAPLIHFRSASRLGYRDFDANRNRMKKITADFKNTKN